MNDILVFVVIGLTSGAVYGLVGTSLALTYRSSGILNFAQGSLAVVAVDVFVWFTVNRGASWQLASVVSVLVVGPLLGLAFELLARRLVGSPPVVRVVATLGILVAIGGGAALLAPHLGGSDPHLYVPPMPATTVRIAGVNIGEDQLIIMGVSLLATLLLWGTLRWTRVGVAMRAVVDDPSLVDVTGTNPVAVRRVAWIIGCTFVALSGVLLALSPSFGPSASTVGRLVIPAFGAAAIGLFTNLPMAYIGGLLIGVGSALLTKYTATMTGWIGNIPTALPVLVLLGALLLISPSRLAERRRMSAVPTSPRRGRVGGHLASCAVLVAGLAVAAEFTSDLGLYTTALVYATIFLSLGLLVRTAGQVSLCQLSFAAVGAITFARLASSGLHLPWVLALLGGAVAAALVGALVAVPAVRLSGVFLALGTLAFGSIMETVVYATGMMYGTLIPVRAPRPLDMSDRAYFYVVLALFACAIAIVSVVNRTRLGRILRGVADSPRALEAQGTTTSVTKLVVFALAAALAGAAGAMYAAQQRFAVATPYTSIASLTMVAVLFVVPLADPWYAAAAAAAYVILPAKLDVEAPAAWTSLVFGCLAVVVIVTSTRGRRRASIRARATSHGDVHRETPREPSDLVASARSPDRSLALVDVTVRFGGVVALDAVSVSVAAGRVTGLIGPNGAGKTTLFNVATGLIRPHAGSVLLGGRDISRMGPAARARAGIGRTFQQPELFESLDVWDTVALGYEASLAGRSIRGQLLPRPGDAAAIRVAVEAALASVGLVGIADVSVSQLSSSERRLVELARCLAGPFDVLLLDEPTAGLDPDERRRFAALVGEVSRTHGRTVLLVEHDVSVVMDLCDDLYVLDFGRLVFHGSTEAARESDVVRSVYLGNSAPDAGAPHGS